MDFTELESMCERAGRHSFTGRKLALTSVIVALCGLLFVFCQSFSLYAGAWLAFSLTFLPLFVSGALLMGLGVVLIRSYHDEVKKRSESLWDLLARSWHAAFSSAYIFMPILLLFLSIWAALGLFHLVREMPGVGDFFASILSSGPFLLHFMALLLAVACIYVLFVATPTFALKSFFEASQIAQEKALYLQNSFMRIVALFIASVPLLLSVLLLSIAAKMTTQGFVTSSNHLQLVVQWLMIMFPYAILLSPSIVFFFNMAAETHIQVHKKA